MEAGRKEVRVRKRGGERGEGEKEVEGRKKKKASKDSSSITEAVFF